MPEPSLLRASLKHHSPQQIYQYLRTHIGKLGIKIKSRQAIIGFESKQNFERVVNEHRVIVLYGKRLEFIPMLKEEQEILKQDLEGDQSARVLSEDIPKKPGIYFPEFEALNQVEEAINDSRIKMMEKVEQKFRHTVETSRAKTDELSMKITEKQPRMREIVALRHAVERRLKQIERKYESQLLKLQDSIQKFVVGGQKQVIDIEPTFAVENNIAFPQISLDNLGLQSNRIFTSSEKFPCKRLFPLNRQQFIVSTCRSSKEGRIKIFDIKTGQCKATYQSEYGAYGLTRSDKLILVGTYQNSVLSINLDEQQINPENTKLSGYIPHSTIFQMKNVVKNKQSLIVAALGHDKTLKFLQITEQQVMEGIFTISIQQKSKYDLETQALALEVHNQSCVFVGMKRKIQKYNIEKKSQVSYEVNGNIMKIKKFNNNVYAVCCQKTVKLLDVRAENVVQTFVPLQHQIKALQVLSDHTLVYGAQKQIGLLDDRRCQFIPWTNNTIHTGDIYDIMRLGDKVISCDNKGDIVSWQLASKMEL